ncbi:hypothetical protein LWI29_023835 [Acer saccharum]|uniref:Uncharacterized protein n=1 Tax=Acer saccharum TaxID=4024 RepID=A0AA39W3J2_ACESA|nr:hypothetical protein LWI29_023835 [Acer saccharum]
MRRLLASAKTKASVASKSFNELTLKNGLLEVDLARAELRCTGLEQKVILVKQAAVKLEEEAQLAKETLATAHHSMLESQQKSKEAKLHYEKLVTDLGHQQVGMEILS